MSNVAVFVGLDYHQDSVQVCVLDEQGRQLLNRSCPNDWRRIAEAAGSVGAVRRAAVEACCGAADLAEELSARAGWHVDLAHPGYVQRMKRSPDKTDFTDGRMLADLTRVGYLATCPRSGWRRRTSGTFANWSITASLRTISVGRRCCVVGWSVASTGPSRR